MILKSIEFLDSDIKTAYANEDNLDEFVFTCSDKPRPELYKAGKAILPDMLKISLGETIMESLKDGYKKSKFSVVLEKMSIRTAKKKPWAKEMQLRIAINNAILATDYIGIADNGDTKEYYGCADRKLSDSMMNFEHEAVLYITGDRAQQKLNFEEDGEQKRCKG